MTTMQRIARFTLAFALVATAAFAGDGSRTYLRGSIGSNGWSQDDMNTALRDLGRQLRAEMGGTYFDWTNFGNGLRFDGEVGYRFTPAFSLGLESGIETSQRALKGDLNDGGVTAVYDDKWRLTLLDVTVNATLGMPLRGAGTRPNGRTPVTLVAGAEAGFCLGVADETDRIQGTGSSVGSAKVTSTWRGSGAVLGIFAGAEFAVGDASHLFARGGYRMRRVSDLSGDVHSMSSTQRGDLDDYLDYDVTLDFSGPYVQVGYGVALGS